MNKRKETSDMGNPAEAISEYLSKKPCKSGQSRRIYSRQLEEIRAVNQKYYFQ